jgi:capsular polysaccharide biosynthesis protein
MVRALQRRGWVLLVTVVVAALCAYLVASIRGATYTAQSTAVVTASNSAQSVVTPDQADGLATTYAVLIPQDTAILNKMATTLGTSVSDVQARLSVFNTTGTALLVIDYKGTSADNAIAGATTALQAIAGAHPVTPNIIPKSVGAVQLPTTASASRGVPVLVAIGVIVGIALGLLMIVAWERVDPRIDRPEDLSHEIGSPTSPVSEISESGANALIARWRALAGHGPPRIALVPVTPDVRADLPKVSLMFSQVQAIHGNQAIQGNGNGAEAPWWTRTHASIGEHGDLTQPHRIGTPVVISCDVPSADLTALQSIMDSDLVVLVARKGTPRAALRELLESLTEFGVSPKWAIFLGSRPAGISAGPEAR